MKKKYDVTLEYVIHKTVTVELEENVADNILTGDYPTFDIPYVENSEEATIINIEETEDEMSGTPIFDIDAWRNEIEKALSKYDSDNVDLMLNEETGWVYLGYHSDNNSFAISGELYPKDELNKRNIKKLLNEYGIGYCI